MAATPLVKDDVELGEQLYVAFRDDKTIRARGVFWSLDPETNVWKLMIATQISRFKTIKNQVVLRLLYARVRIMLKDRGVLDRLPLRRVELIDSDSKSVRELGKILHLNIRHIRPSAKPPYHVYLEDIVTGTGIVPGVYIYDI